MVGSIIPISQVAEYGTVDPDIANAPDALALDRLRMDAYRNDVESVMAFRSRVQWTDRQSAWFQLYLDLLAVRKQSMNTSTTVTTMDDVLNDTLAMTQKAWAAINAEIAKL